jgi:hypothetical protein
MIQMLNLAPRRLSHGAYCNCVLFGAGYSFFQESKISHAMQQHQITMKRHQDTPTINIPNFQY